MRGWNFCAVVKPQSVVVLLSHILSSVTHTPTTNMHCCYYYSLSVKAKSTLEELCTYNKSDISAAAALIAKPLGVSACCLSIFATVLLYMVAPMRHTTHTCIPTQGKADAKLKGHDEQRPTFHSPPAPPSHVPIRMAHDQAGLVHCS